MSMQYYEFIDERHARKLTVLAPKDENWKKIDICRVTLKDQHH